MWRQWRLSYHPRNPRDGAGAAQSPPPSTPCLLSPVILPAILQLLALLPLHAAHVSLLEAVACELQRLCVGGGEGACRSRRPRRCA